MIYANAAPKKDLTQDELGIELSPTLHEIPSSEGHCDERPLISVLVPVFRPNSEFFVQMLRSILEQRFVHLEVVIVEDPSDASCLDMLPLSSRHRIRCYKNDKRTSLVGQRNFGLSMCDGEYIALMDADDIASPYRLAKQLKFMESHPNTGVLGSNVSVIDEENRISGHRTYPTQHRDILRGLAISVPLCQPSVMIRRSVIDEFGGYRKGVAIAEDYDLWSRLIQAGVGFANLPEPLLYYRIHRDQLKQVKIRETICAVQTLRNRYWSEQPTIARMAHQIAEGVLLNLPKRWTAWFVTRYLWGFRPGNGSKIGPVALRENRISWSNT